MNNPQRASIATDSWRNPAAKKATRRRPCEYRRRGMAIHAKPHRPTLTTPPDWGHAWPTV